MKSINILVLGLTLTFVVSTTFAQKSRPRSNVSKPKTTTKAVAKGSIELEAGLLFNSGDVKPVGRATFYVLKEDAKNVILTQEQFDIYNKDMTAFLQRVGGGNSIQEEEDSLSKWSLYSAVLSMDGRITPNFAISAKKSIETASITSTTTGFDGKATFESVPVGDYHIFGYYKVGKETTYWNVPITVKAGVNKIILDNENSME
jgi:hypothetical protein